MSVRHRKNLPLWLLSRSHIPLGPLSGRLLLPPVLLRESVAGQGHIKMSTTRGNKEMQNWVMKTPVFPRHAPLLSTV